MNMHLWDSFTHSSVVCFLVFVRFWFSHLDSEFFVCRVTGSSSNISLNSHLTNRQSSLFFTNQILCRQCCTLPTDHTLHLLQFILVIKHHFFLHIYFSPHQYSLVHTTIDHQRLQFLSKPTSINKKRIHNIALRHIIKGQRETFKLNFSKHDFRLPDVFPVDTNEIKSRKCFALQTTDFTK